MPAGKAPDAEAGQQAAPPVAKSHSPAPAAAIVAEATARTMIRPEQFREMMGLMKEMFSTGAAAQEWLLNGAGTNNPQELLATEADGVLSALLKLKHEMHQPAPLPPAPAEPVCDQPTDEQRQAIRAMTTELYGDRAAEKQADWLRSLGYSSILSCTRLQAAERISFLDSQKHPKSADADIPF